MNIGIPGLNELTPLLVFAGIVLAIWAVLSMISQRNARTRRRSRNEQDDP